jgi:hypothetical protein
MFSTLERLRTLAVVSVLGIALVHVAELPDKLGEAGTRYQAALFVALIAGCVALALAARRTQTTRWCTGVLAVSALPFVSYLISRTVGLPGGKDDIGAWADPTGIASLVFEALGIGVAARALSLVGSAREALQPARAARRPSTRPELAREQW